ncbi:alpha/beta hydrolase fold domain-containing protein [Variovorax defluvii]|uniref:alpha/beta hydrolase fold domain-containing protein n=1 Tax=Variovorax defluvii TaxID=913761 RepID=UPI0031E9076F
MFDSSPGFEPEAFASYAYPRVLDPQLAQLLEAQRVARGPVDRYALPFPEARLQLLQERRLGQTGEPAMQSIETSGLQVADRWVGLRWYHAGPAEADAVALVYLHGGGWCVGSNDTHDTVLRHLAVASALPVCGVDYSLAPEHPFPAALDDVRAVVDELLARHPRVVLAGDSAGANLVLAEAMRRRDAGAGEGIAALLLFYGVYAPLRESGSCAAYGGGQFGLSVAAQRRYLDAYLPTSASADARVFPLLGRLHGLPPAYLLAAELDLLLDDSVRLHHAMAAAGSRSVLRVCAGMNHGFLNHANLLGAAAGALREAGGFAAAVAGSL